MSQLWTEEKIRQLIPDIDSQLEDRDVPTVVIQHDGGNIFLQFENRHEVEFLIAQLSNLLIHPEELDLGVTVKGNVTRFGDYCAQSVGGGEGVEEGCSIARTATAGSSPASTA